MISASDHTHGTLDARPAQSRRRSLPPIVAVAASAGGIDALSSLLNGLTAEFTAAVLVVLHISPRHPSRLAQILSRHTSVVVTEAMEGERPIAGHAYLAPSNEHLLLGADHRLHLSSASAVHFARPAADVLFDSVARVAGDKAIGVVLSGTGADGTNGVVHIKNAGGVTIAQDKATAEFWGMPNSAIRSGAIDHVVPIEEMADLLRSLTDSPKST